jgi:hypothetical protein
MVFVINQPQESRDDTKIIEKHVFQVSILGNWQEVAQPSSSVGWDAQLK